MPPTKKAAAKEPKAKEAKEKKSSTAARKPTGESNKLLYSAGAIGVALIAGLIGTAHFMKKARRKARIARLACERDPECDPSTLEDDTPKWVVSEQTLMLAVGGLVLLGAIATVSITLFQRARASYRKKAAKLSEREAAQAATAQKKAALADAKAALAQHKKLAVAKNAEERAKQREFEAKLLADIREHERKVSEAAAAEAALAKAEADAARFEAQRLDEELRSRQSVPVAGRPFGGGADYGSGAGEDNGWDVGDYDENEEYEAGGEDGAGSGSAANAAGNDDDDDDDDDDEGIPSAANRLELDLNPAARGTRVSLENLAMPENATARTLELTVTLACAKCQKPYEFALGGLSAASASRKSWCDGCGSLLSASLRPCLLHAGSNVLGHVDAVGCHVTDAPRLSVLMQCGRCDDGELALPPLQRGRTVQSGCRVCHAPLSVKFGNVLLERLASGGGGRGKGSGAGDDDDDDELEALLKKLRKKNVDQFKAMGLIIGKPLPQKGACRHYKHSYRWLRFPCCGRAYPCAVCHEESDCPAASLGVWASRMLCGKCSREMPYADTTPCAHCGNTFCKPVCTQCSSRPKHHTTRSVPPHQRSRPPPLDLFS